MMHMRKNVHRYSSVLVGVGSAIGFGVVFIVCVFFCITPTFGHAVIFIGNNNVPFSVEVAQTRQARAQGLMRRKTLCHRCGMLFVFSQRTRHSFWMKNTPLSLDIFWIDDGRIVEITEHATPMSTEVIIPSKEALQVLELPAGSAARYDISVGDIVHIEYTEMSKEKIL